MVHQENRDLSRIERNYENYENCEKLQSYQKKPKYDVREVLTYENCEFYENNENCEFYEICEF